MEPLESVAGRGRAGPESVGRECVDPSASVRHVLDRAAPPAPPPGSTEDLAARLQLDPELIAASREVDRSLLRWALALSPRERLRMCSRAASLLLRLRRV